MVKKAKSVKASKKKHPAHANVASPRPPGSLVVNKIGRQAKSLVWNGKEYRIRAKDVLLPDDPALWAISIDDLPAGVNVRIGEGDTWGIVGLRRIQKGVAVLMLRLHLPRAAVKSPYATVVFGETLRLGLHDRQAKNHDVTLQSYTDNGEALVIAFAMTARTDTLGHARAWVYRTIAALLGTTFKRFGQHLRIGPKLLAKCMVSATRRY